MNKCGASTNARSPDYRLIVKRLTQFHFHGIGGTSGRKGSSTRCLIAFRTGRNNVLTGRYFGRSPAITARVQITGWCCRSRPR